MHNKNDNCEGKILFKRYCKVVCAEHVDQECKSSPSVPFHYLFSGTREQAYVYAISSAALAHSLARACSIGVTTKCSCGILPNSPPEGDFKWGGCGDDVRFGIAFSQMFTESSLTKKGKPTMSKKAQMNRHNNRAGRKVGICRHDIAHIYIANYNIEHITV